MKAQVRQHNCAVSLEPSLFALVFSNVCFHIYFELAQLLTGGLIHFCQNILDLVTSQDRQDSKHEIIIHIFFSLFLNITNRTA